MEKWKTGDRGSVLKAPKQEVVIGASTMEHVKFSLAEKGDQSAAERWFIQLLPTYFPGEFASVCECVRVKERFHMVPYWGTAARAITTLNLKQRSSVEPRFFIPGQLSNCFLHSLTCFSSNSCSAGNKHQSFLFFLVRMHSWELEQSAISLVSGLQLC